MWPLVGIGIVILLWLCNFTFGAKLQKQYYFNLTNSVPIGIYKVVPGSTVGIGEYVVFDLPDRIANQIEGRSWYDRNIPLIKRVEGLPGDQFEIRNYGFFINDSYIGPVFQADTAGLPLPQDHGVHTVRPGRFLPVAADIPNSFDGRYYGDVATSQIRAIVKPIWVLKEGF
ncbi:peptidase s24/s26a/s26b/s26c [Lucifera butyrica]|uniref:Peptidase s24/s26a/s26b/s26c n=1 Tax=Lucifera butyrica TaxID=1351585 RepID=A0A498R6W0_9FIRM|nr:peptidase s24/s26a/s26b/s26c [Lucifera butyrica]